MIKNFLSRFMIPIICVLLAAMAGIILLSPPWNTEGNKGVFKKRHEYVYKKMGDYIFRGEKMGRTWDWEAVARAYIERADTLEPVISIVVADTLDLGLNDE